MATLPQITLNFNRKIKLSNDGGSLSSDTDFCMRSNFHCITFCISKKLSKIM